jgi:hypothetical protein
MRNLRKLVLLAITASAVLAVGGGTAFATNPDFPHDDVDAGNWKSVVVFDGVNGSFGNPCEVPVEGYDVGDCAFDTGDWHEWDFNYAGFPGGCEGGIAGEVSASGQMTLDSVTIGTDAPFTPFCNYYPPANLPWGGEVCVHVPTGSYWVRQDVDFGNLPPDSTFGELRGEASNGALTATTLRFGTVTALTQFNVASYVSHAAEFALGRDPEAYPNGLQLWPSGESPLGESPGACSWPELA